MKFRVKNIFNIASSEVLKSDTHPEEPKSRINTTPRIAIGAIFKNEGPYILEWIAYHKSIGIEHFIIADNMSDDGSEVMLQKLHELKEISCFRYPSASDAPPQMRAYGKIIRDFSGKFDWIAFIDADEFLFRTGDVDLSRLLSDLSDQKDIGAVVLNWANYGSSGAIHRFSGPVYERFIMRSQKEFGVNFHYKSIVRPEAVDGDPVNPHFFKLLDGFARIHTNGDAVVDHEKSGPGLSSKVVWDFFRINHYIIKSRSEFDQRKRFRGRATMIGKQEKGDGYFKSHDTNDVKEFVALDILEKSARNLQALREKLLPCSRTGEISNSYITGELSHDESLLPATGVSGWVDRFYFFNGHWVVRGWASTIDGCSPGGAFLVKGKSIAKIESTQFGISRLDVAKSVKGAISECGFELTINCSSLLELLVSSDSELTLKVSFKNRSGYYEIKFSPTIKERVEGIAKNIKK